MENKYVCDVNTRSLKKKPHPPPAPLNSQSSSLKKRNISVLQVFQNYL